jgi:hypothetical protein
VSFLSATLGEPARALINLEVLLQLLLLDDVDGSHFDHTAQHLCDYDRGILRPVSLTAHDNTFTLDGALSALQ